MEVKRGDVVVVVMQGDLGKPRPAVVIQSDRLGKLTSTVLVCPMSSDIREPDVVRPIVKPDESNGLRAPSQIMTDKLAALRHDRIRRILGTLDEPAQERLDRALLIVLGLDR